MRIAILGTRGVPARYSGFETLAEEVGARLVARGHQVVVYCRPHVVPAVGRTYRGMRLVHLPTVRTKHLDTPVHTLLSALHCAVSPAEAALVCGVGNAPFAGLLRAAGKRVVINVDGLDWQRAKWGRAARRYLRLCEAIALRTADVVVTDASAVRRYYREQYRAETALIGYGAHRHPGPRPGLLARLGLAPRQYLLFVGRLVPENGAHTVLAAWSALAPAERAGYRLVIVGDAPYSQRYIARLKRAAPGDVLFTGYVFGEGYAELSEYAHAFVLAASVGGMHPVLVEQLGHGNCVIVNDTPANRETAGGHGLAYDGSAADLARQLRRVLTDHAWVAQERKRARAWAATRFDWEEVTDRYLDLLAGGVRLPDETAELSAEAIKP